MTLGAIWTDFDEEALEDRFQAFRNPSAFFYPIVQFLTSIALVYNGASSLRQSDYLLAVIRIGMCGICLLLMMIDLGFLTLHRAKELTAIELARRQRRMRVLALLVSQSLHLVITYEFWSCTSKNSKAKAEVCYMAFDSRSMTDNFFPILLPVNFFENLLFTTGHVIGEIAMAQLFSGQPVEMRATRALYSTGISALLLAIQWCLEREDRLHFLAVVHREELQQEVTQKQHQIAATLESITEPEQLQLLLAGQDTVHQREQCAVMVARFSSFVEWRQQVFEPAQSVMVVDILLRAFELNRMDLGLEAGLMHGDMYIASLGLRSERASLDPSPLIALGVRMQTIMDEKSASLRRTLPALRLGFATGACSLAFLRGETLSVIIDGPAYRAALQRAVITQPGSVMVPRSTWELCRTFDRVNIETQWLEDVEFVVIRRLRRSGPNELPPDQSPSSSFQMGSQIGFTVSVERVQETPSENNELEAFIGHPRSAPSEHNDRKKALRHTLPMTASLREFFRWSWPSAHFSRLVQQRAERKERLVAAIWVCSTFVEGTVIVLDDAMSTPSALLLLSSLLVVLSVPLLPLRAHLKLGFVGTLLFLLQCAASMTAGRSMANRTYDRFTITFAVVSLAFCDGFPGIPSALFAFSGWLAITLLIIIPNSPSLDIFGPLWQIVVFGAFCALVLDRDVKTQSMCRTLLRSQKLLLEAEEGRLQHERVLIMLLPSYIVQLASKRTAFETKAIVDRLGDVAMLSMRLSPSNDFLSLLRTCHWLDQLFAHLTDVSLFFLNGDTLEAGGPLQRPSQPMGLQPATSAVAGRVIAQVLLENEANAASVSLLQALSAVYGRGLQFSAILHRFDVIAVVRGLKQPAFALEGRGAEVSRVILDSLTDGQCYATPTFLNGLPNSAVFELNGLSVRSPPERWRFRAIGFQRLYLVQKS